MVKYLFTLAFCFCAAAGHAEDFVLASGGKAACRIVADPRCDFAAQELSRWLGEMSGARFAVSADGKAWRGAKIVIRLDTRMDEEQWSIRTSGDALTLTSGGVRGATYAVYGLLERLGCSWIAPSFPFFEGGEQFIPRAADMAYKSGDVADRPEMRYRKFYVEEGKTHTAANLLQLIDWMPKAGFNTLVFPMDYQGSGRVKWDNWRETMTPELQKRGIIIEVGGHGYENFLNARMEGGALYKNHPEWFGMDEKGERSTDQKVVFCTSDPAAAGYIFANVLGYLRTHPEIGIFDFWPPDMERWCVCPECGKTSPEQRHVRLVNALTRMLSDSLPRVRVECLAYSRYLNPPPGEKLDSRVLLDFCAINQDFEHQTPQARNARFDGALRGWMETFKGQVSVYSYWRKYRWRSLPNIFPHYMQEEMRYYRSLGLCGVSVYSEPGDWFTYGPNYFVLGRLAQHPDADVDSLMHLYVKQLYGPAAPLAGAIYREFERTVRSACRFPDVEYKPREYYAAAAARIDRLMAETAAAIKDCDGVTASHLRRLEGMLRYVRLSIDDQIELVASGEKSRYKTTDRMLELFGQYPGQGLFVP